MDFIDLCKKIIRTDSTPTTGNEEAALFCADLCRQAKMHVTLQEATLNGQKQFNLFARPQEAKPDDEIIFQSHLDTVEPGPLGNWTKTDHNPFKATIDGDHIYGLGTTDVKLDFLCKLRALTPFVGQKMKRPFVLIGTFGEEVGMIGAELLMKTKMTNAKMAIIGEPSELQVVYANNGYMVVDFEIPFSKEELARRSQDEITLTTQEKIFRGKAAHSSTPHLGDNAINKLVAYLEKMPKGVAVLDAAGGSSVNTVPADAHVEVDATASLTESVGEKLIAVYKALQNLEREFLNFDNAAFSPSHPTLNMGLLKTTDKGLHLSVSFRITPDVALEQIDTWLAALEATCAEMACNVKRTRMSSPALTPLESDLVKGCIAIVKKLGLKEKPITKASGTECSVYRKYGLDCIVFGPGVSVGNSHTANEYNILSQLETASKFYAEAATRFCL